MSQNNINGIQTRLYEGRVEDRGYMSKEEALSFVTKFFNLPKKVAFSIISERIIVLSHSFE